MAGQNGLQRTDPATAAIAAHTGEHAELLHKLLAEARAETLNVAVGDFNGQEMVLEHFPTTGIKRLCVRRTGTGFNAFPVTTTPTLVLPYNEGRIGGTIVNYGANAVLLYLTAQELDPVVQPQAGVPVIWLAGGGGSWDFRMGNVLWAGSVTAVTLTSTSTLSVAEV